MQPDRRRRGVLAAVAALCAVAACDDARAAGPTGPSAAQRMDEVMWNRVPIGGPFRLTDHTGRPRGDADFRGRLMLVYFGFTACPDVCPTDLQQIGLALELLGDAAREVAPVFVTLDPARDTPELLAAYVAAFHPAIVGLTGDAEAIRQMADAYRVYHARVEIGGRLGYTIDHSSFVYLMGRDGRYLGYLPPGTPAGRMVEALRPHLAARVPGATSPR